MPILKIRSLDDPRLGPYRDLKKSNATRWSGNFVAEGEKLVRRLLASDFQIESLLLGERYLPALAAAVPDHCDILVVPDAWIAQIVGFNFHRGVLACARRKSPGELSAVCQRGNATQTIVVCPDVQDPENLGAILRIASAFAIDAVVLGPGCCDPFSRRVLRVSMGAAFRVPIFESGNLAAELTAIRERHQVKLWAAVVDAQAVPFDQIARPPRFALLLGSEGHGLAPHWLAMCDARITIPIEPQVDSLNVAVAAGILLYHATR
jgi:tRNA G18 (ribose-2'-O)-methylase SpoU